MDRIAIYGSLCQGFFNYKKLLCGRVARVEQGKIHGTLYHLRSRGYPALLPGDDEVYCEIMTLQGDILQIMRDLNQLENACMPNPQENEYNYTILPVFNQVTSSIEYLGVYMFNMSNPNVDKRDMEYVYHGNWPKYMREEVWPRISVTKS